MEKENKLFEILINNEEKNVREKGGSPIQIILQSKSRSHRRVYTLHFQL